MATGWKRGLERVLVGSGAAGVVARARTPSAAILAYHNIVPKGEPPVGDASLHVDQVTFANQLDFLVERHEVVPLADLLRGRDESGMRSRVTITFDDAYQGALTVGLSELRARKLPATVFVPPGLLGADGFWWDLMAPSTGGSLPDPLRRHALEELEGRQDRILHWASELGLLNRNLPPYARPADEWSLLEEAKHEGVSLGAHTWSHPNLAKVPSNETRDELDRSKKWLRARAPRYIDWLAYPYGLRNDDVVAEAAERFEGAVLIEGGLAQSRGRWLATPHSMPRLNVPRGLELEGLALRLAGLLR